MCHDFSFSPGKPLTVMAAGEAASDTQRPQTIPAPREKGKTVAEPQETQQETQARWEAQRIARSQEQRAMQAARKRKTTRTWFIVGAIVIIVAVIVKVVLL